MSNSCHCKIHSYFRTFACKVCTKISFGLPVGSDVKLEVFNILGQKVITLKNGHMPAGRYSVIWNGTSKQGKSVSSGVYFYRLETDGFTESKKMMLLK